MHQGRETFLIDRGVRLGEWPKPRGISLAGKRAAVIGYGNIGQNTASRLLAADMRIIIYDPYVTVEKMSEQVEIAAWPDRIEEADFIVINCSLTPSSHHLLNEGTFAKVKRGVRIVNVGRGPVIDEHALEEALMAGTVHSAALDVFEKEPLPMQSPLRTHPRCVFGSHNASNTIDAVRRASRMAIEKLFNFLEE